MKIAVLGTGPVGQTIAAAGVGLVGAAPEGAVADGGEDGRCVGDGASSSSPPLQATRARATATTAKPGVISRAARGRASNLLKDRADHFFQSALNFEVVGQRPEDRTERAEINRSVGRG